jgi:alkyl hydroperoxide reductase 1
MSGIKAGDSFPEGVTFNYVPATPDTGDVTVCGRPQPYDASKEFKDKKVVLFSVPGAFTGTCSAQHLPGFIKALPELHAKGVDQVICIAFNDPFVMSGWGKAYGFKDNSIILATDDEAKFSKSIGWTMGPRTARYAIIIDHGKVTYAEREAPGELSASSAETVLSKL